jgi:hypothetical protein
MPRASTRWSYSRHLADFSQSTVTVLRNGQPVPVQLEPLSLGSGDNTLVFKVNDPDAYDLSRTDDIIYTVVIENILNAEVDSHTYTVTVINPFVRVSTTTPTPCPEEMTADTCAETCFRSGLSSKWTAVTEEGCSNVRLMGKGDGQGGAPVPRNLSCSHSK